MNVAALRQHIRPDERIHGIFTDGGDKPNIVPARAAAEWYVRAGDPRAGSSRSSSGCSPACRPGPTPPAAPSSYEWQDPAYADMRDNLPMVDLYAANAARLGRTAAEPDDGFSVVGSTDMGNVSYAVPSIHPMIKVSPADVSIHTPEFATYAGGPRGRRGGARRGQGDGHDDRRPVAPARGPRRGHRRVRRGPERIDRSRRAVPG